MEQDDWMDAIREWSEIKAWRRGRDALRTTARTLADHFRRAARERAANHDLLGDLSAFQGSW